MDNGPEYQAEELRRAWMQNEGAYRQKQQLRDQGQIDWMTYLYNLNRTDGGLTLRGGQSSLDPKIAYDLMMRDRMMSGE